MSFERNAEGDRRDSFSHHCVPNVEIKDFRTSVFYFIERVSLTYQYKMKKKPTKKLLRWVEIMIEVIFLDFASFKNNYRLTPFDLNKQNKLKNPLQINFIADLKDKAMG